jgi:hypothetical protein
MSPETSQAVELGDEQRLAVSTTVKEIEARLCAMLGVPIPSAGELVMENKASDLSTKTFQTYTQPKLYSHSLDPN